MKSNYTIELSSEQLSDLKMAICVTQADYEKGIREREEELEDLEGEEHDDLFEEIEEYRRNIESYKKLEHYLKEQVGHCARCGQPAKELFYSDTNFDYAYCETCVDSQ